MYKYVFDTRQRKIGFTHYSTCHNKNMTLKYILFKIIGLISVVVTIPVSGGDILQIRGDTIVGETFSLVCSSNITNPNGQYAYTIYRSSTPGDIGRYVGTIAYVPTNSPPCHEIGRLLIPYPFGCEETGRHGYINITVTTGTNLTEHDKYWRCQTAGDPVAASNNAVHVFIIDPVKNVQVVAENGTPLTSPAVIPESDNRTRLMCTTGPTGSRPKAQLTLWFAGTTEQQITSGVTSLPGQQLPGDHVIARTFLSIARPLNYKDKDIFCRATLHDDSTDSTRITFDIQYGPRSVLPSQTHVALEEGQSDTGLSCVADCNPTCTYRWLSAGTEIHSGSMLKFTAVSVSDTGEYYCEASNVFKNNVVNTLLSTVPVKLTVNCPNDLLHFTKEASSTTTITLSWLNTFPTIANPTFILAYKTIDTDWRTAYTSNRTSSQSAFVVTIEYPLPDTVYLYRLSASRDNSPRIAYAHLLAGTNQAAVTTDVETSPQIGLAVGVTLAVSITIQIVVTATILFYRRRTRAKGGKETPNSPGIEDVRSSTYRDLERRQQETGSYEELSGHLNDIQLEGPAYMDLSN